MLCWTLAMVAMIYWPLTFTPIAAFAASFRVWCFGYDPFTGKFDMARLALVVLDPIFFTLLIGAVWKRPMLEILRRSKNVLGYSLLFSSALVVGILVFVSKTDVAPEIQGKSIADFRLERTHDRAPPIQLTDHNGSAFSLVPGRVTIVTAFYAHCRHTCPKIIEQAQRALAKAELQSSQVDIALVTMDPENDTVDALHRKAAALELGSNWHLLTGSPSLVNQILDQYEVARVKDKDGNIGHSNTFYVIDTQGKIAFRIGLGTAQEVWLKQVLQLLTRGS
jgi:protein SCO1/2